MKQQNTETSNNQSSVAEDQATSNAQETRQELTDLEPRDDVKGGQTREHVLLARQVGVPAL